MKFITLAAFLFSCLLTQAFGQERGPASATAKPAAGARKPANLTDVEPVYEEPGMKNGSSFSSRGPYTKNKDGYDGARVQIYYDPMSSYSKFVTNSMPSTYGMGYSQVTGGMGGVQAMWAVWAPSDFEFQTGLDYVFPVDVQGQQLNLGSYTVNSQTLNIAGFKALQANYRINLADFTTAAYGGFGVYYGKNQVTLQILNQNNIINYTKLMMVYVAGARLDYNFNRNRTIAAGIGAEFFVPTKIADQISQSGNAYTELPGQSSQLQSNMDFWTGIGCRLYGGIAAYF